MDNTNRAGNHIFINAVFILACAILIFGPPEIASSGLRADTGPDESAAESGGGQDASQEDVVLEVGGTGRVLAVEASAAVPQQEIAAEGAPQKPAADTEAEPAPEEPPAEPSVDAGNVTVNFKGADIKTVFAYLSEASGVDIVSSPDVKGTVDLKLTNKPWKTALDLIVRNYSLAYERDGDIIRVLTADKLKQEELTTQTFPLNYATAKDVVSSIKDIVTDRGRVVYDERTNTIVVTEIPTNVYNIGKIIARLDKRTQQVLIEARVIETLLNDDEKLGIDWNVKFSVSGAKRPTTFPFDSWKTPFASKQDEVRNFFPQVNASTATVSSTSSGSDTVTQSTGTGTFPSTADGSSYAFPFAAEDQFSFGTLDFSQFSAVLELLKQRSNTDIVSNPRIATLNNMPALINIGQTLNLPTYERNSTTGKMEITGYDAKDLGIILKVTPHINDRSEIVVELEPQISDLLRYDTLDRASGVVAPVFSIRQAKTQVMVKDGDTIFIGGLIKENDVKVTKKLPFIGDLLGDVPGLGLLFTKKENVKEKTELIFFITVNLMNIDKELTGSPKAAKAHRPEYTLTQQGELNPKKRLDKR